MCKLRPGQLRLIIIINPRPLGITILFPIHTRLLTHGQVPRVDPQNIVLPCLDVVRVVLLLGHEVGARTGTGGDLDFEAAVLL